MNKDEYNHFHGYQDKKDALDHQINNKADLIYQSLWSSTGSIMEALSESLSESADYAAIIQYCHRNNNETILGAVTLELIDVYLSNSADELAEEELT